jgi:hypothetical protein
MKISRKTWKATKVRRPIVTKDGRRWSPIVSLKEQSLQDIQRFSLDWFRKTRLRLNIIGYKINLHKHGLLKNILKKWGRDESKNDKKEWKWVEKQLLHSEKPTEEFDISNTDAAHSPYTTGR